MFASSLFHAPFGAGRTRKDRDSLRLEEREREGRRGERERKLISRCKQRQCVGKTGLMVSREELTKRYHDSFAHALMSIPKTKCVQQKCSRDGTVAGVGGFNNAEANWLLKSISHYLTGIIHV